MIKSNISIESHYKEMLKLILVVMLVLVVMLTFSGISQLSTHHSSISTSPEVITHSTPQVVHADLYSTFI